MSDAQQPAPTSEHVLNEVDAYGPTYMAIAERLGGYDTTTEDAQALAGLLGLQPGTRVLDAGCGFGRFSAALAALGCEVVGVDISPAAIAEAERRCPGPQYVIADLTQPLELEPFDLIVNVYSSFGYGATRADDVAMLNGWRALTKPGGQLVMQLSDLERSRHRLGEGKGETVRVTNGVEERLRIDWETGMLNVRYELDGSVSYSNIRMYWQRELEQMVTDAGYEVTGIYGDFAGAPKRPEDRLVLVARAVEGAA